MSLKVYEVKMADLAAWLGIVKDRETSAGSLITQAAAEQKALALEDTIRQALPDLVGDTPRPPIPLAEVNATRQALRQALQDAGDAAGYDWFSSRESGNPPGDLTEALGGSGYYGVPGRYGSRKEITHAT